MTTRDYLKQVRERLEAATPGPWRWGTSEVRDGIEDWTPWTLVSTGQLKTLWDGHEQETPVLNEDEISEADATFIAHARTDVERLLDVAEAAQDLLMASHQLTISERSRIGVSLRNLKATLARLTEDLIREIKFFDDGWEPR